MEYLKYGLLNDKLVYIDTVERGLKCNCVCPSCQSLLIAKKGFKKQHHFAHYKSVECNRGMETALHMRAKDIAVEYCKLWVPTIEGGKYDSASKKGIVVKFDKAEKEKQLSNTIRGDVVLYAQSKELNVEIKVTHKVDHYKKDEIIKHKITTIEIDFSDMVSDFTDDLIVKRLMDGSHTELIYSPKAEESFKKPASKKRSSFSETNLRREKKNIKCKLCGFIGTDEDFWTYNMSSGECYKCRK